MVVYVHANSVVVSSVHLLTSRQRHGTSALEQMRVSQPLHCSCFIGVGVVAHMISVRPESTYGIVGGMVNVA